ncbi:MAG: cytochrome c3 family protein [Phycisphaerales bacterium]|nr:cytochrome c3 family protein [Phycisphaerales bacterium]
MCIVHRSILNEMRPAPAICRDGLAALHACAFLILLSSTLSISLAVPTNGAVPAALTVAPTAGERLTGRIIQTFEAPAGDLLLMPSDVVAEPDGGVAVADGVNDRVVRFDSSAAVRGVLAACDSGDLKRPMGLTVDRAGNLWIADTGNARIVVCTPRGEFDRAIALPDAPAGADYTDLVLSNDERSAWAVDNDGHRLVRIDLSSGTAVSHGSQGSAGDQFHYPFLIAADASGHLYVSDVANGRVSVWLDDARPAGHLGAYGVDLGQLYRPKGIACDPSGRVWISDGRLGVIQAFAADGTFIDVLRNEEGEPLLFTTPSGLAAGEDGDLYVVEVKPGRIQRVRITTAPATAVRAKADPVFSGQQPQACTVCHIEWMKPLVDGRGTELIDRPENPIDHPLVSREANCFSCHDGSIADSRRRIWMQHGHASGVTPSEHIAVPADLPLSQGQVVCRTCHTAHTRGGSGNAMKDAVFLRVQSEPGELCTRCHADLALGPGAGMHPIESLRAGTSKGARRRPRQSAEQSPQCLTCHNPHGSSRNALLTQAASSPQGCIQCHAGMTELDGCAPGETPHPVTGLQVAARFSAGGDNFGIHDDEAGAPSCLACHTMHHAAATDNLLVAEQQDSSLCLACHASQAGLIGTAHDLRGSRPDEPNARGELSDASGPCGACHGVHSLARPIDLAVPTESNCTTCHREDGCAEGMGGQPFAHPVEIPEDQLAAALAKIAPAAEGLPTDRLTCVVCHDPHQTAHSHYLRAAPYELCIACHTSFSTRRDSQSLTP